MQTRRVLRSLTNAPGAAANPGGTSAAEGKQAEAAKAGLEGREVPKDGPTAAGRKRKSLVLQSDLDDEAELAHTLIDPSLRALRACSGVARIPAKIVSVDSPLSVDTRQLPHAANLLDLRLSGEGTTDGGCLFSRIELANSSDFYSGLATHEQPSTSLKLPVGHAGVKLVVTALYTKQVELDGESFVDFMQAASYLQVKSCLEAGGQFLLEHVFDRCPSEVLDVARSLGLQALLHRLVDRLAARFFRYRPVTLAKVLEGMGTVAAVQLLGRDDLCCPLECFLVEVLAEFAYWFSIERLLPLLDCVRWTTMTLAEVRAAVLWKTSRGELLAGAAALHSRAAHELEARLDTPEPEGQPRAAAKRTIQLSADVDSDGNLVAAKSVPVEISGVAKVYIAACPPMDSKPTRLVLWSAEQQFAVGLQAVWLAFAAGGQHRMDLCKTEAASSSWYSPEFLASGLQQPLCSSRGSKKVLLACYLPKQ
ncbi:hypothetical protein N2152v2_010290 [Parachlorella kessleri]